MTSMRALLAGLLLLAAAPAAAQGLNTPVSQFQLDDLMAQQQLANQRAIAQANELMALEARLRTEQALQSVQAARAPVPLPELPYTPAAPTGVTIDTSKLPTIPDAALAASNARVQEVVRPR